MNEKILRELNKELQGVIMGQNEIMKLVEKAKDYKIIELLDTTLSIAEKHKLLIGEEVKGLEGEPAEDEGTWGKILEIFNAIKESDVDTDKEVLQTAIKGTEMGFKAILDFLIKEENLDEDFKKKLVDLSEEYTDNIRDMGEYLITLD